MDDGIGVLGGRRLDDGIGVGIGKIGDIFVDTNPVDYGWDITRWRPSANRVNGILLLLLLPRIVALRDSPGRVVGTVLESVAIAGNSMGAAIWVVIPVPVVPVVPVVVVAHPEGRRGGKKSTKQMKMVEQKVANSKNATKKEIDDK